MISEQIELKPDTDFCIKEFFTETESTYSVTVIIPPNHTLVESPPLTLEGAWGH